jgi:hypothetical protein
MKKQLLFALFQPLLLSIALPTLLLPNLVPSAHALGCVNLDVSNQVNLTGSKDNPGVQQNNVKQNIDPNCVGNADVHKTTQLHVGPEGADQTRNSSQSIGGGATSHPAIPAGVMDAGNVNVQVGTGTNIYVPGLDPKYLPKK